MTEIRLLTLDDQPLVSNYLQREPPEISEHTFTNLYVWQHSRPVYIMEAEDTLLFLLKASGSTDFVLFGPPVGKMSVAETAGFLASQFAGAVRIPEKSLTPLPEKAGRFQEDRNNADYVYRVVDLAELGGRRYAKKRNRIKQCLKNFHCEYEPLTPQLMKECAEMQERWCEARQCAHDPGLCSEFIAVRKTMDHFAELAVFGGAIRVEGLLQAYAIAEPLNPDTAVWHFEKAIADIPGLGQVINQWFAKFGLRDFDFVNREQDLGIPGLRQAKESYYPHHLLTKYSTDPDSHILPRLPAEVCI